MNSRVLRFGPIRTWLVFGLSLVLPVLAPAAEKTFQLGGVPVALQPVESGVEVRYTAMRLNRALNVWNAEVTLHNASGATLPGPVVLHVEGFTGTTGPQQADGLMEGGAFYDLGGSLLSGALTNGQATLPRTLTLGVGTGSPSLVTRVYVGKTSTTAAIATVRTLDGAGLPLTEVEILQQGPSGSTTNWSDSVSGFATLGGQSGAHLWRFTKPDHLPVWRWQTIVSNTVASLPAPRLAARSTNAVLITPIAGAVLTNATARIVFAPGSVTADATATLTPLDGQNLPAFLPTGWSPLNAFWFEANASLQSPGVATLVPADRINPAENAALVRWNEASLRWDVLETQAGAGTNALAFALPGNGAFALVVADNGVTAPPAALVGQPLLASSASFTNFAVLSALGTVTPSLNPASRVAELVTARAEVDFTNALGALPSGLFLRTEVTERYELADGSLRIPPRYETHVVAYRRPGSASPNTLRAVFPLRPLQLFGGDELSRANIHVEVRPPAPFSGGVLDAQGGQVATEGLRVLSGVSNLTAQLAVELRRVPTTNFHSLSTNAVLAFELATGRLPDGKRLVTQFGAQTPNGSFVLARVLDREGVYGLEPVERFASGTNGMLASVEPVSGERLSGLTSGGQYLLVRVAGPQGLVRGLARDAQNQPLPGAVVRVTGQPWVALANASGHYRTLAPQGAGELVVTDRATGDATPRAIQLPDWQAGLALDLAATPVRPFVTSVSPLNGATNVPLVAPITVAFSEPLQLGSALPNGLVLLGSSNQPVPATVSFNLRGTVATVLPTDPLAAQTVHTLVVSTNLADLTGLKLSGANVFSFTTASDALSRDPGAQLVIYEPTNGVVRVRGTSGFAEPRAPVVLVNETTGFTTTVLAGPDGAFDSTIPAAVDDFLSAVLVNGNGTRNVVPAARQIFADGRVGLFNAGGAIEVASPNGPIQLVVEPNAIPNKSVFRLDYVSPTNLPALVTNTPLDGGKVFGGLRVRMDGDDLAQSVDVVFPVKPEDFGLPAGADLTNNAFALVAARQVLDVDGQTKTVYEVIDRMHYEDGKLVTHSPPFLGLLGTVNFGYDLIVYACMQATGGNISVSGRVWAAVKEGETILTNTMRYVPGATVSVVPPNGALPGQPGRLRPGTTVSTATGTNAAYAIIAQVYQSGAATVRATHPRFPGQAASAVLPVLTPSQRVHIGNVLMPVDLVFSIPRSDYFDDTTAPNLAFAHAPQLPQPGLTNGATLRVVASDNLSTPDLTLTVEQVLPLVAETNLSTSDIVLTALTNEPVGTFGVRETFQVTSPIAARVILKGTALDAAGNDRSSFYALTFGGSEQTATNAIPPADPNDRVGPAIVASFPSQGSRAFAPGQLIRLSFNEPVDRAVVEDEFSLRLFPEAGRPSVTLSDDQRELTVVFADLAGDTDYTLTLTSGIKDLLGNRLDQDATQAGNQSYTLGFRTAALPIATLPGLNQGGGGLIHGLFGYVLERNAGQGRGAVGIYDLSSPAQPRRVSQILLGGGYPRDLAMIPQYAYKQRTNDIVALTNDLLVVVGGNVGVGQSQYLRVYNVSNPLQPELVAAKALAVDGFTVVPRAQWSAPLLGYAEFGNASSIGLLNLQAVIIAENLTNEEFRRMPELGFAGVDLNGDGDYVDEGEELPLPSNETDTVAGKVATITVPETTQVIEDFSLADGGAFVGAVLSEGKLFGTNGAPTDVIAPAAYRTLFADGDFLERTAASVEFTNARPRRVTVLFDLPFPALGGIEVKDLALVSLRMLTGHEDGRPNRVAVIDVTIPADPRIVGEITIPAENGDGVFAIVRREDGKLLVATDRDVLLLDPAKLLQAPAATGALHPAIVGVLPGAGESMRTFGGLAAGLQLTSSGGRNVIVQSAPVLEFVSFPGVAPFQPQHLAASNRTAVAALMQELVAEDSLRLARLRPDGDAVVSTLTPPNSLAHYYTRVHAPGSAGPVIELSLESLNRGGTALKNRGLLFPPVRAMGEAALGTLGQTPRSYEAPVRSLRAWRVSDDPTDPNYNVYLSRPFALLYEEASVQTLAELKGQFDREVLWSGAFLRASLDPSMRNNPVLGAYAAEADPVRRTLLPGASVVARALAADYLMGPNPMPLIGGVAVPAAFGTLGAHNGEVMLTPVDMTLPGRRLPIEFRRAGGGQGLFDGPFGRGWDFNFNQRMVELRPAILPVGATLPLVTRANSADSEVAKTDDVLFYNGAGRVIAYRYFDTNAPAEVAADPLVQQLGWLSKGAAFYTSPKGVFNLLVKMKDGRFARLDPDGTQTWYGADGRLDTIYDRYTENSIRCAYNDRGELVRIEDELRRPLDIGYYRLAGDDAFRGGVDERTEQPGVAGRIARLKDYTGRDVLFFYTEEGLLERKEGPLVTTAAEGGFTGRQVQKYLSSDASRPEKSAQALTGMQSGSESGTPLLAAVEVGQASRDVATKIATAGKEVGVSFNHANTARAVSLGGAKSSFTGQDGSTTAYEFDAFGRAEKVTLGRGDETPEVSQFTYNADGLATKIVYPEGNWEEFIYDTTNPRLRSRGNLLKVIKHPGPRGGATLEARATFDPTYNEPLTKTDYNGKTASMTLSSDKRGVEKVRLGTERESYRRNAYGQVERMETADGIVTVSTFTSDGFLETKTVGPDTTRYVYEGNSGKLGLPSRIIDPRSLETTFVHDERGQTVRQERGGLRIENSYDERGFVVRVATTQDTGVVVVEDNTYDQLGFKLTRTVRDVETDGGLTNLVTTYTPDAASRVKKVVFPGGETHEVEYDHAGRMTAYVVGNYREDYLYDRNGNLTTNRIGNAEEVKVYDGHDRIVQVRSPLGGVTDYEYDGNNNLLHATLTDPVDGVISETRYAVDDRNRYTEVRRLGDSATAVVGYGYDPANRSTTLTDASGQTLTTSYDAAGRLWKQASPTRQVVFTHDGNGNLRKKESTESGRVFVEESEYNERDQRVVARDSRSGETTFGVGLDGRILWTLDRDGHGTTNTYTVLGEPLSRRLANGSVLHYGYNANREIASLTDGSGNGIRHRFDALGRLVATRHADGSETLHSDFDGRNAPQTATLPGGIAIATTQDVEGKLLTRTLTGPGGNHAETYRHDVAGRLRVVTDPSGSLEYRYDKLGYAKSILSQQNGQLYTLGQEADGAGFRREVTYPSALKVTSQRDATGRLTGLTPSEGEPILSETTYIADQLVGGCILGSNVIATTMVFDDLKRPAARRYTRVSDGKRLAEVRYGFSPGGALVARQFLDRAGRGDFFGYDGAYQLLRSDRDVRPSVSAETARTFEAFAQPDDVSGNWSAGRFARTSAYTPTDVLVTNGLINPDGFSVLPLAARYDEPDALLHVGLVDGVVRSRDAQGNVTSGRLWVRLPGSAIPTAVNATFRYNLLGQLTRVERADGVTIVNEYGPAGLRIRRQVTGDPSRCVPGDTGFLYDGANLIEERDLADNHRVIARYFYGDDGDELLAGDRWDANAARFRRFYFLTDALRSVLAVADAVGSVVERYHYDTWGLPVIEVAEAAAPRVSAIVRDGNSLLVRFSEPVLPVFAQDDGTNLVTALRNLNTALTVKSGGNAVAGTVRYEEALAPFGTTFRFVPNAVLAGNLTVEVAAGSLQDEWNNLAPAEVRTVDFAQAADVLFTGAAQGSTAGSLAGRSTVGLPFQFQGQVFDDDAGLLYCRARFYDPALGQFLQRDPAGYEDSVNHYAGFKNNPVNFRDATGMATDDFGAWLISVGEQASIKEDGLSGYAVGSAVRFVGALLQTGTGVAEGLDKLEKMRPGTLGVLDMMEGANLIAGDVLRVAGVALSTYGAGHSLNAFHKRYGTTLKAYTHSGYQSARDIVAQKLGRRTGAGIAAQYGFHTDEISGIHQSLLSAKKMGQEASLTVRMGMDYEKGAARRQWVSRGLMQKRAVDYMGKSGKDARMTSQFDGKIVVSDLDIGAVKINGKLATTRDYTRIEQGINRAYSDRFRARHGNSMKPNPPIQHHGQFQMSDQFGKSYLGHELGLSKMEMVGHPGHTVTFRLDAKGNLLVNRTPGWSVDADILRTDMNLRKRMAELDPAEHWTGNQVFWSLPPSWHTWK